jgi:release factor glutamine methyltransferase
VTTLAEAAAASARALRDAGVASPEVDARWLVEAATGRDPRREPDAVLADDVEEELAALVARRCAREPLQLVVGMTAFRTLELACRPGVFVPRPETEVLAGLAIELVRAAQRTRPASDPSPVVVQEPCCGTGAIGLAVASEVAGAVVLLGDRSAEAVSLATENRDRLAERGQLRSDVTVHHGDLLGAFATSVAGPPDLVVSNPPYLPDADLAGLDPEVADHDPHTALAGGPDGHELVDALLEQAARTLRPGGAVLMEIDARRSEQAIARARAVGLVDAEAREDLTGAPRFVLARRPVRGPSRR